MVDRRSGHGDSAKDGAKRSRRGFVTVQLPRHVIPKRLAGGETAYYYNVPTKYRKLMCSVQNEPLGTDFAAMTKRADVLNGQFDEWDTQRKGLPISALNIPKHGTVDWLFREYKVSQSLSWQGRSAFPR
jgi:hypothetical protein